MKKIQILGVGCPKCNKLAENAKAAVQELSVECEIEKVTQINDIMAFGVMMTPAIAIDGEVKVVGLIKEFFNSKINLRALCLPIPGIFVRVVISSLIIAE